MAQAQIKLVCKCGLKPTRKFPVDAKSTGIRTLKCGKCDFGVCLQILRVNETFPRLITYAAQEKASDGWGSTRVYCSFREPELGWLEHKGMICKMTPQKALQDYIDHCEKTRQFFANIFTRVLVNSIAGNQHDVDVIKMLLGVEALELGN